MKKILTSAIIIAVAAALISSCTKESPAVTGRKMVRATVLAESGSTDVKTSATRYINEKEQAMYQIDWVSGDAIAVYTDKSVEPHRFTTTDAGRKATFTGEIPEGDTPCWCLLPYDAESTALPSQQKVYSSIPNFQSGDFSNIVIASESIRPKTEADFGAKFIAVSGIVKFTLPEDLDNIVSVDLIADRPIAGDMIVDYSGEVPVITPNPNTQESNIYNAIAIANPDGTPLAAGRDYYVSVFPIRKTTEGPNVQPSMGITLRFQTSDFKRAYKSATLGAKDGHDIFAPNVVKSLGLVCDIEYINPRGGLFTAGKDGHLVRFAQGNLQYRASDGIWRFAQDSWDAQGNIGNSTLPNSWADEGARATQTDWIDLFPWGASGWTYNSRTYLPYSCGNNQNFLGKDVSGFVALDQTAYREGDCGYHNKIANGGNTERIWRLPKPDELAYIIGLNFSTTGERPVGTISGVAPDGREFKNVPLRYMSCGVRIGNEVRYGVALLPDGFSWPYGDVSIPYTEVAEGKAAASPVCINYQYVDRHCHVYDLSEFSRLEKYGVIFLPCAGYRGAWTGNPDEFVVDKFNIYGRYLTAENPNKAGHLAFYENNISFEISTNTQARSVRLIMDVDASSSIDEYDYSDSEIN